MKLNLAFLFLFIFSATSGALAHSKEVPVLLWNIKGSSLPTEPVSAFTSDYEGFSKDIFQKRLEDNSLNVLAFLVEKLSMEDLASAATGNDMNLKNVEKFLDSRPHLVYPSAEVPLKYLEESDCGLEHLFFAQDTDPIKLQDRIILAFENSCVVVLHLQEVNKLTAEIYTTGSKTSKNDVIGVFTGISPSWVSHEPKKRQIRSLSVDESISPDPSGVFINLSNCTIMYMGQMTLIINGTDKGSLNSTSSVGGSCDSDMEKHSLELTFDGLPDISQISLELIFEASERGSWALSNSSLKIEGAEIPEGPYDMMPSVTEQINVPLGFSYSCGHYILQSVNTTVPVLFIMKRFQVQPFNVSGEAFKPSFDCTPFFTLPIWMGIFVTLLLIVILNTGIYALFSIKTMDRFDDPKGKTISVPT